MATWDIAVVACVLLAAVAYLWRSYKRRALVGGACKSGCGGGCGTPTNLTRQPALVQIGRPRRR